jgi:anti-sigma regulatory factor (Ser/Thr protein kinase)
MCQVVVHSIMTTFRATFPSTFASVSEARKAVREFAQRCGFGRSEISDIVLAVGEACSNAAEHGHVERGQIIVRCTYEGGVFRAEIADDGQGFRPQEATDLALDSLDWIGRGRGIPIMRALMDSVTYRICESGTTAVLEKRYSSRSLREAPAKLRGLDAGSLS